MTDRPIIMSGPMVQAILREIDTPGTGKRQTRRVLKPQPPAITSKFYRTPSSAVDGGRWVACLSSGIGLKNYGTRGPGRRIPVEGDRLWVREAFRGARGYDGVSPINFGNKPIWYEADGPPLGDAWGYLSDKRRPSIHMPRWASRITLLVENVRVQRVQDISEDDARAEGANQEGVETGRFTGEGDPIEIGSYVCGFAAYWDHLNAKRGYEWDTNPWVVAVTFRPILANIDNGGTR